MHKRQCSTQPPVICFQKKNCSEFEGLISSNHEKKISW